MKITIRGINFNFGQGIANPFTSEQRADYVMANSPFNVGEWWDAKLENTSITQFC